MGVELDTAYSERDRLRIHRYDQLVFAGLNPNLAQKLAEREEIPMAEFRRLLNLGADPETAYLILI